MRCVMCGRPLMRRAIESLDIGPVCAKKRGLWAGERKPRRPRLFDLRHTTPDPAQLDWVNLLIAGAAGESLHA